MPAPLLTLVEIREVNFDNRKWHRLDRIVKTYAVLGERARIQDAALDVVDVRVDMVEQGTFVVGLEYLDLNLQILRQRVDALVDLVEGDRSVDLRLAPPNRLMFGPCSTSILKCLLTPAS